MVCFFARARTISDGAFNSVTSPTNPILHNLVLSCLSAPIKLFFQPEVHLSVSPTSVVIRWRLTATVKSARNLPKTGLLDLVSDITCCLSVFNIDSEMYEKVCARAASPCCLCTHVHQHIPAQAHSHAECFVHVLKLHFLRKFTFFSYHSAKKVRS